MTALQFYAVGCAIWSLLLLFAASRADARTLRSLRFNGAVISVVMWPVMLILVVLMMRRAAQ